MTSSAVFIGTSIVGRALWNSIVIASTFEYESVQEELRYLEDWLSRLHRESPGPEKGLTKAGIRKMIARLHEELALFEGQQEVEAAKTKSS